MTKKLFVLLVFLPAIILGQNTIKGTFSPAKEYEWAILYKVTPTTSIYVQNKTMDETGKFTFVMDSTMTSGIYRIVYALPQEEYNFDLIYNGQEDIELTFHKTDGVDYLTSKENQLFSSYMKSMDLVNQAINNYYVKDGKDEKAFMSIFKTLRDTQDNFEKASEGLLASNFIKANGPYIPAKYEDVKTYSKNIRANYFKEVDFSNNILQSSNFLIERMLSYIFGMSVNPEDQDFLNSSVDDIAKKMADTPLELQKTLLQIVWQQFVDMEFEKAANHLTEAYLLDIAQKTNDEELQVSLEIYRNTSIGALAPDFKWIVEEKGKKKSQSLSSIDVAENYAVVFWSSTCSHCLKEMPELKKYVSTLEEGKLKVIAVGLEEDPYRWNSETSYYPDFIHVYGEGKWDNVIGDAYGVAATPTYFILDKNKKIIEKPYDFETLKAFMNGVKSKKGIGKMLEDNIRQEKKGN